jgi:hypothetical protein
MEWQPIDQAPKDGTIVDLWARGKRFAHCFWSPSHNAWIQRIMYKNEQNELEVLLNQITNATYFIIITSP